jgi:hypothetical protein
MSFAGLVDGQRPHGKPVGLSLRYYFDKDKLRKSSIYETAPPSTRYSLVAIAAHDPVGFVATALLGGDRLGFGYPTDGRPGFSDQHL